MDLAWDLPGGYKAAFSTRADGDIRDEACRLAWFTKLGLQGPVALPRQVHGKTIAVAKPGWSEGADALALHDDSVGGALVFGADCPGLLVLGDGVMVLAHCGWRGVAGFLPRLASEYVLQHTGKLPISAFIGPGISGPAYEVDDVVLHARQWPDSALRSSRPGHAYLDLAETITCDLQSLGITDIQRSGVCTHVHPELHSYRHQGPGLVQALTVWQPDSSFR